MRRAAWYLVFLLVLPGVGRVSAQSTDPGEMPGQDASQDDGRTERRSPRFFRRPARSTPAEQLALGRSHEDRGWFRRAARTYGDLVYAWHDAAEAAEAQFGRARALEAAGKYRAAFDEYQYLIEEFSAGFPYEEVLERQFRIANRFMTERHWDFFGLPGYTVPESALDLWEKLAENGPMWERTPQALFFIATTHEAAKDYEEALDAYIRLRNRYPDSPFSTEADFRRARCLYELALDRPRDEQACRDALSALAMCLRDYPDNPTVKEAQAQLDSLREHLADMYYARALFYERGAHKHARAALMAYQDFARNFPGSRLAPVVARRMEELTAQLENTP